MSDASRLRDLFTAADVARFCGVDLKTIHNWVAKDKLPHFRTEGRHLRFRRADVVAFLRAYGYPLPAALRAGRPRVVVADGDAASLTAARRALARRFDVTVADDGALALVAVGTVDPDALVLDAALPSIDVPRVITALQRAEPTRHVRVIVIGEGAGTRDAVLAVGAAAFVEKGAPARLREVLDAITGLRA